jgi:hypothetical protein
MGEGIDMVIMMSAELTDAMAVFAALLSLQ